MADLLVSGVAFGTRTAPTDERNRDSVSDVPFRDELADGCNSAGQFVAWNMWELDTWVVTHPAVPVAPAHAGSAHCDDNAVVCVRWLVNVDELWGLSKGLVHNGLHSSATGRMLVSSAVRLAEASAVGFVHSLSGAVHRDQLAMPAGREDEARQFYDALLVSEPRSLIEKLRTAG